MDFEPANDGVCTELLNEAFMFHFNSVVRSIAIGFIKDVRDKRDESTNDIHATRTDPNEIISRGLVCRHTTTALKYLSCRGLTCHDLLVSFHLSRQFELQGKRVSRIELEGVWPPPSWGGLLCPERIAYLQTNLSNTASRVSSEYRNRVKKALLSPNGSIVFRQRYSRVQGPDIFVVFVKNNMLVIHIVKCTHYQHLPSRVMTKKWWSLLGVHVSGTEEKPVWNLHRKSHCPAAWTNKGIHAFARHFQDITGLDNYLIERRLMAAKMKEYIPLPSEDANGCQFLSVEMLEPTYSVFAGDFETVNNEDKHFESIYGESTDDEF